MDEDTSRSLALLAAELIAIERWDDQYWRGGPPDVDEIVAHVSRRERRGEIIRQLADITRTPEISRAANP